MLSNSWITIAFYVIIAVLIIYFLYKSIWKRLTKTEIEQEKQSGTKENSVRTVKNEKVIHQSEQPLPTDTIRKRLIEWERTLPYHEQRRSYETMQQWLKKICRTGDIIPIYESVRYGEKVYTELNLEKTMRWIERDGKVDIYISSLTFYRGISVGISKFIGIAFDKLAANKMAKLDPIECLRFENNSFSAYHIKI